MPIYEYEPDDRECLMCDGLIAVIQGIDEDPLLYCPCCGLEVRRIVSRASFSMRTGPDHEKAARRGFTTWRKSGAGVWEKLAGGGVDVIAGTPEQIAEVKSEQGSKKILDLDQ